MSETKRPLPVGVWHEEKKIESPTPSAPGEEKPEAPPAGEETAPAPESGAEGEAAEPPRPAAPEPDLSEAPPRPVEPAPRANPALARAVRRAAKSGEQRVRTARNLRIAFAVLAAGILIALFAKILQDREAAYVQPEPSSAVSAEPSSSSASQEPEEDPLSPADPDLWSLLLANTENPLPDGYKPEIVNTGNGQYVDERILEPLNEMFDAAAEDGIDLYVRSAYRSEETQRVLFDQLQSEYMAMGYSRQQAYELAKKLRNLPGTSEHQTGLAVDIVSADAPGVNLVASLAETEWAKWLAENAADYGFILRYPEGKTEITGTSFEPWHYRYVGVEDAQKIMDAGLCLEEYLGEVPGQALDAVTDTEDDPLPASPGSSSKQGGT